MTDRGAAGFTLIEVLVALAILAAVMGFAFEATSGGLSGLERARREQDGLQLAQSLLARIGHDIAAQPVHLTETEGVFSWDATIGAALATPAPIAGLAAYPVTLTVSWRDGLFERHIKLVSARLGSRRVAS